MLDVLDPPLKPNCGGRALRRRWGFGEIVVRLRLAVSGAACRHGDDAGKAGAGDLDEGTAGAGDLSEVGMLLCTTSAAVDLLE